MAVAVGGGAVGGSGVFVDAGGGLADVATGEGGGGTLMGVRVGVAGREGGLSERGKGSR